QPVSASQRDPLLMPIQRPAHFVIAARRVEVRNVGPKRQRRAPTRDRIETPVGQGRKARRGSNRRCVETEAAVSEHIVFAGDDAIGAGGGYAGSLGKLRAD